MVFLQDLHDAFFYIGEGAFLLWILLSIYLIVLVTYQQRQIKKNFKAYEDDIDKLIEFCQRGIQKYWIFSSTSICHLQLGICYLIKNDIKKAKQELSIFGIKSAYKASYYPNFVIAIVEDNMELAEKYYKRIEASNFPFEQQSYLATKIMQMIETKVFDEEIENSQYPCLKEYCHKFKIEIEN
ncbi:MAG: hypothetical protein K2J85_02275 [Anaeroplasmataceae bacterium]|nr:hypothetical protein [Anaeroplasmataceae bacterium]